jgi:hypothetical protein
MGNRQSEGERKQLDAAIAGTPASVVRKELRMAVGQVSNVPATQRVLVDSPSLNPGLGFFNYVNAIVDLIRFSRPQFAIGIFGSWGSGKTTLMQAVQSRLKNDSQVICVDFSAWRYEKEENLIVPLIDTIREAVLDWSKRQPPQIASLATKTAEQLGNITKAILAGVQFKVGLPNAAEVSFEANKTITALDEQKRIAEAAEIPRSFYHASFRALNETFKDFKAESERRIVVLIDDLDRCLPAGALEILESMKLFFDLPGFIFVVGLDRKVVEWCVEARYLKEFPANSTTASNDEEYRVKGADYINKIFQVPFTLPPVAISDLDGFLNALASDNKLIAQETTELNAIVRPHLEYLVGDTGVNPRRLKQYINTYILQRNIKPNLNPSVLLALLTIQAREDWSIVRSAVIAEDRQLVVQALKHADVGEQRDALQDVDPEYADIPLDFLLYVAAATAASEAGPARPLLDVHNLDEFIYLSEVTRSAGNRQMVDILPKVSKLRRLLEDAIDGAGELDEVALKKFAQSLTTIQSHIPSLMPGPLGDLAYRYLEEIKEALKDKVLARSGDTPPAEPPDKEALLAWRQRQEERLRLAKRALFRAYDSQNIVGSSVAPSSMTS